MTIAVAVWLASLFTGSDLYARLKASIRREVIRRLETQTYDAPDHPSYTHRPLALAGPLLYDLYAELLADPARPPILRVGIFNLVSDGTGDRSRFVPLTLSHLTHPDSRVRGCAVGALGYYGSHPDAAAVVPLLWDVETTNCYQSARVLARIGDDRSVVAMNYWLTFGPKPPTNVPYQETLHAKVAAFRDELKVRLDRDRAALPKR